MKIFLALVLQLSMPLTFGSIVECGTYKLVGSAKIIKNAPVIILNEQTLSELVFSIPISEEIRLAPYIDHDLVVTATLTRPLDGNKGEVNQLQNAELRVHNPLAEKADSGMTLIKKMACQKKI